MKKTFSAVLVIILLLCGCTQGENSYDTLKSQSESSSSYKGIGAIPTIENDRIHIENETLMKVDNLYKKEEKLVLPAGVSKIDKNALKYNDNRGGYPQFTTSETLHLCIPKRVKLGPKNFELAGPMDITFEEGRQKIEPEAFAYAGHNGRCFKVTLPKTCKVIGKKAFYESLIKSLKLNDGLIEIGDWALFTTKCDIPDSVEKLGNHALDDWSFQSIDNHHIGYDIEEFKLPKNIKSIGDYCIGIEYYPVKPVYISQNVETIGKHAFTFLKNIDVVDKNKPRIKFVVDKKNKYYKSDKKGWIYTKDGKKVWSSSKRY